MNRKRLRKTWKWLKILLLVYILLGIGLYIFQEKFLFHPKKLKPDYRYSFSVPFREVNIPVTNEKNLSLVQFLLPDSQRKGIVLYFHGNRENINRYAKYAANFTRNGYEVWMVDYPGYGKSTGKRTEQAMYDDALIVYKMAQREVSAEHIVIYGKSLGTGIAAHLASVRDCQRLILETPYYSMDALAKHYFFMYPVMPMSKFAFPTYRHFEYISAPITIFHGTNDEVIPYKQAKRLVLKKLGTELITLQNGEHNNLNDFGLFQQKLDSLLRD